MLSNIVQWEFQVGPSVGISAGDEIWVARYILEVKSHFLLVTLRLGEGAAATPAPFGSVLETNRYSISGYRGLLRLLEWWFHLIPNQSRSVFPLNMQTNSLLMISLKQPNTLLFSSILSG